MGERRASLILLLILCFATSPLPLVSASEDSWTTMGPIPSSVDREGRAAVVDGKIYVIGKTVTFEYDPETDTWTNKTSMPTPRNSFAVAACQDKIYVIGGIVGETPGVKTGVNEAYDPATDSWETKTSMPTNRSQLNANVVNGKIYLIGGRTGEAYSTVALNEVYDTETETWTTKEPILYPVVMYASAVVDNKIYVIGGQDEFHDPMNLNFTQIYDPENDTWSQGAPVPAERSTTPSGGVATLNAAAVATSGAMAPKRLYFMGGGGLGIAFGQNYIYDPVADVWSSGLPMSTPRYDSAVAVVDDLIYVIGGREDLSVVGSVINERYTPVNWVPEFPSWTILPLLLVVSLIAMFIKGKVFHSGSEQV